MLLFLRVSMLNMVLSYLTRINFRLLYIVGLPTLLAIFFVGGIRRTFEGRPAYYWFGFVICMTLAVPFSSWRISSLDLVITYVRTAFPMLFVVGGLVITWRECKVTMYAILWGAVVNLLSARVFGSTAWADRAGLEFGTVANPNDFAGHLLLVIPFLLWPVLASRHILLRVAAFAGVAYGLYYVLASGSRGALVGLVVAGLFFLWRGSAQQKVALLLGAPILFAVLAAVVPQGVLHHIRSFSADNPDADSAAIESSVLRTYLLRTSVAYTLRHPLFGVGPGQFGEYEGTHNQLAGMTHGYWRDTHNTYTQVSSECGILAALFYVAAVFSSFRLLSSVFRQARARRDCQDIRLAAFCVMLGMVGYCTAITFLNFAYFFYLPAMVGLAVSFSRAAEREFRARGLPAA
ncbi:MAG: O-antigen ligase family protein [Bryobacteraceae bacterium]